MSELRCGGIVGLLAVLWLAALGTAHQQQPDFLDQLLTEINRTVQSNTQPLLSRLDSQQQQLDAIVSRLDVQRQQLDGVTAKLTSQDSRLDSLSVRLDSVSSQLNSVSSRLDGLSTRRDCDAAAPPPRDCSDMQAGATSGIHLLQPGLNGAARVEAFCDLDTDGGNWTVFQRRADVQPHQDFYLGWRAYKEGFGELDAEFWWGMEHLWTVTSARDRRYELRVDLEDFDGEKRHAVYQGFRISSEADGYRLWGTNYTGDAGDSLSRHFGKPFTTKDKDQDNSSNNCALERIGAWWYDNCHDSNLNGRYLSGATASDASGVNWKAWRGWWYSLKTVEMKIRPAMNSK